LEIWKVKGIVWFLPTFWFFCWVFDVGFLVFC
jgi:hypothetical protein